MPAWHSYLLRLRVLGTGTPLWQVNVALGLQIPPQRISALVQPQSPFGVGRVWVGGHAGRAHDPSGWRTLGAGHAATQMVEPDGRVCVWGFLAGQASHEGPWKKLPGL